jgi:hypothetical protein
LGSFLHVNTQKVRHKGRDDEREYSLDDVLSIVTQFFPPPLKPFLPASFAMRLLARTL